MMYLEPSNLEVPYFLTKTACWRKQQFHQQEWGCHQPQIWWKDISTMMIWAILGTQEVRRWGIIMGSCTYKYESLDTHQRTQCLICIHVQLQTYDISTFTCCNLPTAHFVVIDVDTYSTLGAFLGQFLFHLCWTNPIKKKNITYTTYTKQIIDFLVNSTSKMRCLSPICLMHPVTKASWVSNHPVVVHIHREDPGSGGDWFLGEPFKRRENQQMLGVTFWNLQGSIGF